MRIVTKEDRLRLRDAEQHDECLIMIGDEGGRPLLKLSVTADGHAIIEGEDGDLAEGIRQLNRILSATVRSADLPVKFTRP